MATWDDMPVNNKQFDQVLQQFAKALVLVGNNLTAAIERNTQAIVTQTVELIKAQTGHLNATTSAESIAKSIETTFSQRMK